MATVDFLELLPAEIWYSIIDMLPSFDQKTCLSVSKMFHDIAMAYVFSHISICLGFWRPFEFMGEDEDISATEKADMKRQANASYEIMRHVMRNPDFGEKVKKVSVRAFSEAGIEMQIAIRLLADALQAMPDLHAFIWHGSNPVVPPEILEAVVNTSKATLREFIVPPELPENSKTLLPSLNRITSFSIVDKDFVPDEKEFPIIRAALLANARTLRTLTLSGDVWSQCPPLSSAFFTHLSELEFVCLEGYEDLGVVLEHLPRLRSFALIYAENDLIPVLREHPRALPDLDSFKLWGIDFTAEDVGVLAQFLLPKRRLRRLDVMSRIDTPGWFANDTSPVLLPLFEILPRLPDLHVVGLSVRVVSLQAQHIIELDSYLPEGLAALLIWTDISGSVVPATQWIDLFASRTSLRYLHLIPDYYDVLNLQEEVLEHPPPKLELFGYGGQIRPIGRDPVNGTVVAGRRWPYPKVYFRTVDDYGDEDWEWLLRHHGYDEDEHFMHNVDTFR